MAFEQVGVELEFKGRGVDEKGYVKSCTDAYAFTKGQEVVCVDPRYFRPTEVDVLIGDPTKAKEKLGWTPKYSLKEMIMEMVEADLDFFRREQLLINSGFQVARQHE